MSAKANTEIRMVVDILEPNECMIFHFEPNGLEFNPHAELEILVDMLDDEDSRPLNWYWWNPEANEGDGNWVWMSNSNGTDKHFNVHKKTVSFSIPHFSMYMLSTD